MAAQTELAELKKAVEELGQKMDKQMVMVQGLVDLFTSTMSKSNLGLVKELPQARHTPAVETKLCSRDVFKNLVEFHEARTHPKGDAGSLSNANAEVNPKGKRVHPIEGAMLCSCKANKGSTSNPQSNRRNPPRAFSCLSAPLASVYEELLDAGSIRPLTPTPLPKVLPASHNPSHFCTYHQGPGHSTNACFRLRHAVQDLIDNGIIPAPLPSKADTINQIHNAQSFRARTQPRSFSVFETPLSAVMDKFFQSGRLKPLAPTSPPKVFPANYDANLFCAFHQMPGHHTDECYRLRHEIQDLIDNGTVQVPPHPNVISNSLPQHGSDPLVGQISVNSTQINPSSTMLNPSRHIVPANRPKPPVSIPFEPQDNMMAAVEVYTTDGWTDSDEKLTKEKTDWLRSFNHESLGLLFKGFSQVGAKEAEEAEGLLLGPDIL